MANFKINISKNKQIKPSDDFIETEEDEELSEMANVRKSDEGLPFNIYIGSKGKALQHPSMMAQTNYSYRFNKQNLFNITIEKNPKVIGNTGKLKQRDIEKVKDFVKINFELLLKYWNLKIGIFNLVKGIKNKSNETYYDAIGFLVDPICSESTGLPMIIYICMKFGPQNPMIKVSRTYTIYGYRTQANTFWIDISDDPKIVAGDKGEISDKDIYKVKSWILLNKKALINYWNFKISTCELIELLKKV